MTERVTERVTGRASATPPRLRRATALWLVALVAVLSADGANAQQREPLQPRPLEAGERTTTADPNLDPSAVRPQRSRRVRARAAAPPANRRIANRLPSRLETRLATRVRLRLDRATDPAASQTTAIEDADARGRAAVRSRPR